MAQYSFDPSNNRERADVIKFLKALDPNAFMESSSNRGRDVQVPYDCLARQIAELQQKNGSLSEENSTLQSQIKEKTQSLKQYADNAAKVDLVIKEKETKIEEQTAVIDHLNNQIHERETKIKEMEQTCTALINETEEKHNVEIQKRDDEITRIQNKLNEIKSELEGQIEVLKKRLEIYEPKGAEVGEEMLFTIDDFSSSPTLIRTNASEAPFKVRVVAGNEVRFQFNTEKGPSIKACEERDKYLLPFCDIIEEEENSTAIRMGEWGIAKLSPSGDIRIQDISKKAKILLFKS